MPFPIFFLPVGARVLCRGCPPVACLLVVPVTLSGGPGQDLKGVRQSGGVAVGGERGSEQAARRVNITLRPRLYSLLALPAFFFTTFITTRLRGNFVSPADSLLRNLKAN